MFRSTARHLTAAAVIAAAILVLVIAAASAQSAPLHRTYHNFCPLTQADVAAAQPYGTEAWVRVPRSR
jgi:hypothetical protein